MGSPDTPAFAALIEPAIEMRERGEETPLRADALRGHSPGARGKRWTLASQAAIAGYIRRRQIILDQRAFNPWFRPVERAGAGTAVIEGQEFVNFASYNYLGLSGDHRVSQAAKDAVDRYGTSVSASRMASGEIGLHRALEDKISALMGTDDAIVFIGGYITNETTIGHLFGPKDLICHDALVHRSALEGIRLSGAKRLSFPHNDWDRLESQLEAKRSEHRGCLIVIEGLYSMDGDVPDLRRAIAIKERFGCALMVDEAHSLGVLGAHGLGLREHFAVDPRAVDLWMGTLSKSLASCGGYIAGNSDVVNCLRYTAPGFVFSVGATPANAAATLAAIDILCEEPWRVAALRRNALQFLTLAREAGLDTGLSEGHAVVPVIVGDTPRALALAEALFKRRINVQPIIDPFVARGQARLRFFVTALHSEEQIRQAVTATAEELAQL